MIHLFLLVVLAVSQLSAMKTSNHQKMEQLVNDLTTAHMLFVMPGTGLAIKTKMYMMCVDTDLLNTDMMMVKMLEKYTWTDTRMTWTPSEYDGIKKISLPMKMIWTPDMTHYYGNHDMVMREHVNVVITNEGMVTWMPMTTYRMRCNMTTDMGKDTDMRTDMNTDMKTNMNTDTKTNINTDTKTNMKTDWKTNMKTTKTTGMCKLTMGSATMPDDMMKMTDEGLKLDMTMYGTMCPMTVTNPMIKTETVTDPCCEGKYSTIKMSFNIKMKM